MAEKNGLINTIRNEIREVELVSDDFSMLKTKKIVYDVIYNHIYRNYKSNMII